MRRSSLALFYSLYWLWATLFCRAAFRQPWETLSYQDTLSDTPIFLDTESPPPVGEISSADNGHGFYAAEPSLHLQHQSFAQFDSPMPALHAIPPPQHYPTLSSLDVDEFLATTPSHAQWLPSTHQAASYYNSPMLRHHSHLHEFDDHSTSWQTMDPSMQHLSSHVPSLLEHASAIEGDTGVGERKEVWSDGQRRSATQTGQASEAREGGGRDDVAAAGKTVLSSSLSASRAKLSALEDAVHSVFYREWNDRRLSCDLEGQELAAQVAKMKIVHPGMEHKFGLLASHRVDRIRAKDTKYRQTYHAWAATYRNKLSQLRATARYRTLTTPEEQRRYLLENFRDAKSSHAAALADATAEEQEIAFSRIVWYDFMERALTPALQMGKEMSLQLIADTSIPYSYGTLSWQTTTKYLKKYLQNVEGLQADQMDQLSAMQRAQLPKHRRRGRPSDYEMGL